MNQREWRQHINEAFTSLVAMPQGNIADVPERAVHVETVIGPLWLHRDDQVMTPWMQAYHSWEEETHAFLRTALTPGMHVLDIGANVDYITIVAARIVGPRGSVIAFEPDPDNFTLLCANLRAAGVTNVILVQAAVSDFTGKTRLSLSDSNTGDHRTLFAHTWDRSKEVACVRIDDLLRVNAPVDFIKLDIQGAEHRAVQGMERTLARYRPQLLAEFWPLGIRELGDNPKTVLHTYRTIGSQFMLLEDESVTETTSDDDTVRVVEALQGGFGTLIFRINNAITAIEPSASTKKIGCFWNRLTRSLPFR